MKKRISAIGHLFFMTNEVDGVKMPFKVAVSKAWTKEIEERATITTEADFKKALAYAKKRTKADGSYTNISVFDLETGETEQIDGRK